MATGKKMGLVHHFWRGFVLVGVGQRGAKSEVRMRTPTQIVLAAADGLASREIGRLVGCTTGTVSKWRVRYARHRFAGLDETGNRGATAKYGVAKQKRILAMLDQGRPWQLDGATAGTCPGWTYTSSISGASYVPRRSIFPAENPGARATIRILLPRRRTSSACTWPRRSTPWFSQLMKSPRSTRWSARKEI